jgi:hypothetical protein
MSQKVETRVVGVDLKNAVVTVEYVTRVTTTVTTTVTVTKTKTVTAVVATAVTKIYTHPLTAITTVVPTNTTVTVIEGGETATPVPAPRLAPVPAGGGREVARAVE